MNAAPRTGPGPLVTTIIVASLLLSFAILSFTAELGKSAVFDEPLHAVGAMVHRDLHDFRINPEDPALFGWWASLLQPHDALKLDPTNPDYQRAPHDNASQWRFAINTLYAPDAAAAADRFLNRSRIMFLLLGVILGAIIARWAYEIGGGYAAIIACGFFAFDPNLVAHSVLIKSDVPMAMLAVATAYFAWRFGSDGRWRWLTAAMIAATLVFNVKLTGIFCCPILLATLLLRALWSEPWRVGGKENIAMPRRLAMFGCVGVILIVATWLTTWATYGFRYAGTTDGTSLNTANAIQMAEERANALPVRLDLWMQAHHLLPEPWLYGILIQFAMSARRSIYLMGSVSTDGYFSYFPLAFLFKTPTATLLAIFCIPVALRWSRSREHASDSVAHHKFSNWWLASGLLISPAFFLSMAVISKVNIGLRHIIVIYPFIFIAIGIGAAALIRRLPAIGLLMSSVLIIALATEAVAAYPNYVAFFNYPSGGTAGGAALLGDSNLDWGQDLPALARWSREHPDRKLFLCYFGTADPAAYGIQYVNLPGGWGLTPATILTMEPGAIAMSATDAQGIYFTPDESLYYAQRLGNEKPFATLNGTIFLYDWSPRK